MYLLLRFPPAGIDKNFTDCPLLVSLCGVLASKDLNYLVGFFHYILVYLRFIMSILSYISIMTKF